MKILVADDDRIARKVLRAFLEEAGFEVVTAENGREALAALISPDPPPVVILDWVMPGFSGPEVCAKLRSARLRIRPYVLMLSSKSDKNDLVAGLDAGADDFISKPFNQTELLARLRVAFRVIDFEVEVQEYIEKLEELSERHEMLGDMVTKPAPAAPPVNGSAASAASRAPAPAAAPLVTLSDDEIDNLAIRAMHELGLNAARWPGELCVDGYRRVTFSAWSGFLLQPSNTWMDLLFEAEPAAIDSLFESTLRRPSSISQCQLFLSEALGIVASSLRNGLQGKGVPTLAPFPTQIQRIDRSCDPAPFPPGDAVVHVFDLGGSSVTLTVSHLHCPPREKTLTQLQALDVLASAYPPNGSGEVPLLNAGTLLNGRHLEKLRSYSETSNLKYPVPVLEPTALTAFFNRGGA